MRWTTGELVWLGAIAMSGILVLSGAVRDMRRPNWADLPRSARVFHQASIALLATGLAGFLAILGIMIIKGAA